MAKVSAAELQKNFGKYRDLAQHEPVAVTNYGRETVVLISVREYERLKALERGLGNVPPGSENAFERLRRHFAEIQADDLSVPERSAGRAPPRIP